jgi:putative membrane protein
MVAYLDGIIILDFFYTLEYSRRKKKKNAPLDILKMRFATGEITKEQYLEHK